MASGRPFDVLSEPEDSSDSDDSWRFSLGASSAGHSSISISSLGSYDSNAMEEDTSPIYDELEIAAFENEANMLCNLLHSMAGDIISPNKFFMMKMLDRPPRYEDIGKDRKVPFDIDPDEPPPLYASIFCPHPAMFQHDSPERPTNDEMEVDIVQPNYFMLGAIHEEPTTEDDEDEGIGEIDDEIIQSEPIRENTEFPLLQNNST